MRDGAIESTATPPPGSSRERQPAVTGDQAVPEPEPARGADLDRDEVAALRAIVEGTARSTGEVFFQSLVRHLASAIGVSYAFVAEFAGAPTRVRTLAYWGRGRIRENVEFDLAGTPCEDVVRGGLCHHPQGVREQFPGDRRSSTWGSRATWACRCSTATGQVLGHLAVFDERPMPAEPRRLFIFRIFAARAAVELERLRVEQQLVESERRYRDLYEEAPNAYVAIGGDRRLLSVNHRATQLLGVPAPSWWAGPCCRSSPRRRPAGPGPRRRSAPASPAGRSPAWSWRCAARTAAPLWVSLWMRPLRGADGRIAAVHSIWVDITDRVLAEAERARLQQQNLYLQEEIKSAHNFEEIIGRSPALLAVLDKVSRVAPTDATVLITGETGTGKELIARAIHSHSRRAAKPLIKLNCAALPAGLVESELFGHEKGAFTGAIARRIGRFELADGGTLFLDEIGELPLATQAKLLRVLQEREFERVGGGAADPGRRPGHRRHQPRPAQGRPRPGVPRGPLLPPQRLPDRAAAAPRPRRGHPAAGALPGRQVRRPHRQADRRREPGDHAAPRRLSLARERPRAGERPRARRHPRDRPHPRPRESTPSSPPAPPSPAADLPAPSLEAVERHHILTVLRQTHWVIDGPRGAAQILGLHPNTLRSRLKKLGITRSAHEPS